MSIKSKEAWAWHIAWLACRVRQRTEDEKFYWTVTDPLAMTCLADLIITKCVRGDTS